MKILDKVLDFIEKRIKTIQKLCYISIVIIGMTIGYGMAKEKYYKKYENEKLKNITLYNANETLKINYDDLEIDLKQQLNECKAITDNH